MPSDRTQVNFVVGDVVNIPVVVTAVGGTTTQPTFTGTTKYLGFDGNADTVGPLDAIQGIKDK